MDSRPQMVLMGIPSGREGVAATLRLMSRLVEQGKKTPAVRSTALQLTRYLPQKDYRAEISALHAFVRDRIRYTRDIRNVETLHTAEQVLLQGQGDCDDKSILLASMLESIGHPTRFIAVAFKPGRFSHVLTEVRPGNSGPWIALETTEPVGVGWRPPVGKITDAMGILNGV